MSDRHNGRDLYAVLGLAEDASEAEIQLAYERLAELSPEERGTSQSELDHAHSVLRDPKARQLHDRLRHLAVRTSRRRSRRRVLDDARLLVACLVFLVAILAFVWYPLYGSRFREFSAGDRLVDRTGAPFGVVVQVDERHLFPEGASAPAYLVELSSTKELHWYPAGDLKSSCRKIK